DEAGVLWTGLANFEATERGQAPVIAEALAGVGRVYGSALSPLGDSRPVGGVLFVDRGRIWWEPRIWLGRGKAHPWVLSANAIREVVIDKDPPPAVRGYYATLRTDAGDIRFIVADPEGLRETIESIVS
ncbi:MAG: hypothetical protein M3082_18150, partial [Candidatus Dormibacteraeota bacterium]|nr:hypothetical protein [Candidatus Dormibacteraeota bacterium]